MCVEGGWWGCVRERKRCTEKFSTQLCLASVAVVGVGGGGGVRERNRCTEKFSTQLCLASVAVGGYCRMDIGSSE